MGKFWIGDDSRLIVIPWIQIYSRKHYGNFVLRRFLIMQRVAAKIVCLLRSYLDEHISKHNWFGRNNAIGTPHYLVSRFLTKASNHRSVNRLKPSTQNKIEPLNSRDGSRLPEHTMGVQKTTRLERALDLRIDRIWWQIKFNMTNLCFTNSSRTKCVTTLQSSLVTVYYLTNNFHRVILLRKRRIL